MKQLPHASPFSIRVMGTLAFAWWPFVVLGLTVVNLAQGGALAPVLVSLAIAAAHLVLGAYSLAPCRRSYAGLRLGLGGGLLVLVWPLVTCGFQEWPAFVVIAVLATFAGLYDALLGVLLTARPDSDENTDHAVMDAAIWVGLPRLLELGIELILLRRSPPTPFWAVMFVVTALVPLALLLATWARIHLRRRWLAKVAEGAIRNWRIVPADADAALPTLTARLKMTPGVLVRVHAPADPFRDSERLEPVAAVAPNRRQGGVC